MTAPGSSIDFDRAYRSSIKHWLWTDPRIPVQLRELIRSLAPLANALELGCGVGHFSHYLVRQGVRATGVDFSPVAIEKARKRVRDHRAAPRFLVGDVTRLEALAGPFDVSFDVGCFHCLDPQGRQAYVSEVARLLRPGGTHLIWALDSPPSDVPLSPAAIAAIFAPHFEMHDARRSRRRLVRSHWYWLIRAPT